MTPMKKKTENNDLLYVMTYDDLQMEINEQWLSFKKGTKKKTELSLLNSSSGNDQGKTKGKGVKTEKKAGKRSTSPKKRKCYYCGHDGHTKNNCRTFKKERDKLFCGHCDCNGHD